MTRLDRTEPTLNQALPGDPRDTTSPRAIATDYDAIVLGTAISPASRALITGWLKDSTTGSGRVRAAVPAGWSVGDKTGTGSYGTDNDVAIVFTYHGPVVIAIYTVGSQDGTAQTFGVAATGAILDAVRG